MNEKISANQRGQSLVLVAAAMVVLVGFVALAVDLGNAYYARRTAQNGADGAALAGVSVMATGINKNNPKLDDNVKDAMDKFAEDNGIAYVAYINADGDETNGNVEGWYVDMNGDRLPDVPMIGEDDKDDVPEGAYGVEAITHITATAFFGGIFGAKGYPIQARAVSLLKQACGAECVVPIATHKDTLFDEFGVERTGVCFNIWNEAEDGAPGSFGWVNWNWQWLACNDPSESRPCPDMAPTDGCSTPALAWNLDPYRCAVGFIQTDDWVSAGVGIMNSDTQVQCYLDYYLGIPRDVLDCGWTSPDPNSFTVIVYDGDNGGTGCGNPSTLWDPPASPDGMHYRVAGFAQMQILGYELSQGAGVTEQIDNPEDFGLPSDFDPMVDCESPFGVGEGNRITALFIEFVTDFSSSSSCYDPLGTLLASPKLFE